MGLDNGIIIKNYTRAQLPKSFRYPFEKDYVLDEVEICYWRKCWGLRNEFLNTCFSRRKDEEFYFKLGVKEVEELLNIITYFLKHPKAWDEYGDSIWTYKNFKPQLKNQKHNLKVLARWMKKNPEAEVVFYDSY